jgi:hypothetical protein
VAGQLAELKMGRNAAQLRADATATGWFNGPQLQYVGDGYTVPWEVAGPISPPLSFTLWAFKGYLDAIDLEASRLHDWLYTPYGALINATREEADDALREELSQVDPISAEVVYAAVRAGGFPYFGTSQTGYVGLPSEPSTPTPPPPPADPVPAPVQPPSGDNIAVAAPAIVPNLAAFDLRNPSLASSLNTQGAVMALMKCVIVFQQTSTPGPAFPGINYAAVARTGGWTESFYIDPAYPISQYLIGPRGDNFPPILPSRAAILSNSAAIIGVRLYGATGGRGSFFAANYPGSAGGGDQPSAALLMSYLDPTSGNVRRWTIRGVPDDQIVGGEFEPSFVYAGLVRTYMDSLTNTNFVFKSRANQTSVFNIAANGLVSLTANNPYAVGAQVVVQNALDTNGLRRGGEFQISAIGPLQNQFTIPAWPYGLTNGGTIYQKGRTSANVTGTNLNMSVERVTTHKVGRPFAGYRGRRSRRRVRV